MAKEFVPGERDYLDLAKQFRLTANSIKALYLEEKNTTFDYETLVEFLQENVDLLKDLEDSAISLIPHEVIVGGGYSEYQLHEIVLGAIYYALWGRYNCAWILRILKNSPESFENVDLEFAVSSAYSSTVDTFPEIARLLSGQNFRKDALSNYERDYEQYHLEHFDI